MRDLHSDLDGVPGIGPRRRRVLLVLLAALSLALGVCGAGLAPWWLLALPGGLLLAFLTVARFSVRAMRRNLDARYRSIRQGGDESTVMLTRKDLAAAPSGVAAGMLPTALSLSGDSSWRAPMGVTVIGGLIFSTILTLLLVPAYFSIAIDIEAWIGRKFRKFIVTEGPEPVGRPVPAE